MDETLFEELFNKAFENAISVSYHNIILPPPPIIEASWAIVLQKFEEARTLSC